MSPARLLRAGLACAAVGFVLPAFADTPPQSPIVWHTMPTGSLSRVPRQAKTPAAIPGGQHAPGVWLARAKWQRSPGMFFAGVLGSEKSARAFADGTGDPGDDGECITSSSMNFNGTDEERSWSSVMQSQLNVNWEVPKAGEGSGSPRVVAVHVERLVPGAGGAATLEYMDAWVDPVTLGSRAIGKGSVPLVRVATGPTGVAVYAGRDAGQVHFVVQGGAPPWDAASAEGASLRAVTRQLAAELPPSLGAGQSDCGFMRVTLDAASHEAEMATISAEVLLPSVDAVGSALPSQTSGRPRTVRRRTLLAHLSSSQSSADPEPLLSVALGWGSREDEMRF
jgi:hypothetical protein